MKKKLQIYLENLPALGLLEELSGSRLCRLGLETEPDLSLASAKTTSDELYSF